MKKEILFKYLHDKRVEGVEAGADKAVVVEHVLRLWQSEDFRHNGKEKLG